MAISEHDRYEMHKWLIDSAGERVAETLMAHLPPTGWADVATKRDLDHLETSVSASLRAEVQGLRAGFHETMRIHLLVTLGFYVTTMGTVIAVLR